MCSQVIITPSRVPKPSPVRIDISAEGRVRLEADNIFDMWVLKQGLGARLSCQGLGAATCLAVMSGALVPGAPSPLSVLKFARAGKGRVRACAREMSTYFY